MSSVVRTITGTAMIASATPPAQPGIAAHGLHHEHVDEEADQNAGRGKQDVVHEADDFGKLRALAVFGEIGAGQHADGRCHHDAENGHDQAAHDGIGDAAALAAGPRRRFGEDRRRQAADALDEQHQQDPAEHEGAEDREQRAGDLEGAVGHMAAAAHASPRGRCSRGFDAARCCRAVSIMVSSAHLHP